MPQQPLASKEAALFRQVLKCYEQKQYKKGLKNCEQILRKHPKHGETLAMKGLITNCMGRTEEAFAIAKDALRQDMKSHVCWHVYGLLYRAEKNYDEAIKAYKMALRFEPDSQQILRDLALLQIQMRDYHGYVESRRIIMNGRPNMRQNWTALAIAHHLAGNYEDAEKVLRTFEDTIKGEVPKADVEHWEACLYRNQIIAESGNTERALEHLDSISKKVLDKVAVLETRAGYLLKLGRNEEAVQVYRTLIERNPEKREYYDGLEKGLGIDVNNRREAKHVYDEYAAQFPRSDAPRRVPLDFLEGDEFREAADAYLQAKLKKGVPSTFANIKALYSDPAKRTTIFELVSSYNTTQENQTESEVTNGEASEATRFRLWTLHFLGKHYDYPVTRDMEKALAHFNKALELEPNTVEVMMAIARVHKHAGDLQLAMEKMDEARKVDKSDRYINTKTAKYQLRNDRNEEALQTMSLFTRNDGPGGPLGDLLEMQCVWFVTEDAESNLRQNKLGLALKRYHAVWDIFETWAEDQFDFHTFSLRKGQIRAYVDMLRWEDTLKSHPMYARAALGAIKCYTTLHDRPHLAHGPLSNGEEAKLDAMDPAEKKKALKKAKREQQKAQEKAEAAVAKAKEDKNKNAQVAEGETKKEDTDPLGNKLAQTTKPLEDATKWLLPLLEHAPKRIDAQCSGVEVYTRRKKWGDAAKCLLAAKELDPEHPAVHELSVRFRRTVDTLSDDDLNGEAKPALLEQAEKILPKTTDLAAFNDEFLARHKDSPAHVRAAARTRNLLNPDSKKDVEQLVLSTLDVAQLADALEGLSLLRECKADETAYVKKAAEGFATVRAFQSASA